ncbi:MAG: hypothetical protein G01um101448_80 [Parcubacteria group bacterium Gr01-1014_48]|nr:MAG: hypothetical protein Greene041614_162 [Parcubacteria group bacterium Greene0416_14]TSC74561.1 MAG: hypothetical protein G01um101448_80 [Parcubacteria group bacterium Gr01-1014_48]TSD01437.1 MAG: hypothetical protein Greene101415_284 [Parcubacteria group bacterium Greene1014_15]TSD08422.1 MAG: hypothetical protein Greene07144_52 [Parcubacteria group bacterium Greene0714_4]
MLTLAPFIFLTSVSIISFIVIHFRKSSEYISFYSLISFYIFLTGGIPWYHIRSFEMWSDVNHWFFTAAILLSVLHFLLKPRTKSVFHWLAIVAMIGGVFFLMISPFPYFMDV